jgi:hypothetical protein
MGNARCTRLQRVPESTRRFNIYTIEEYASIIEADEDSTLLLGLAILVEQDRNHQTTNVARGSRDK